MEITDLTHTLATGNRDVLGISADEFEKWQASKRRKLSRRTVELQRMRREARREEGISRLQPDTSEDEAQDGASPTVLGGKPGLAPPTPSSTGTTAPGGTTGSESLTSASPGVTRIVSSSQRPLSDLLNGGRRRGGDH